MPYTSSDICVLLQLGLFLLHFTPGTFCKYTKSYKINVLTDSFNVNILLYTRCLQKASSLSSSGFSFAFLLCREMGRDAEWLFFPGASLTTERKQQCIWAHSSHLHENIKRKNMAVLPYGRYFH